MNVLACAAALAAAQASPPPIIDVHLHAHTLERYGSPPPRVCTNDQEIVFPGLDPRQPFAADVVKRCPRPLAAPLTDEQLMRETLDVLVRRNIRAVTTGRLEDVARWAAAAPDRIIPATPFDEATPRDPEEFRRLFREKRLAAFAEVSPQYDGGRVDDPAFERYFALAEELDIPVGIHLGEGPPGGPYRGFPRYRAGLTSPFQLEGVLLRHPRLRVYVMHYASPLVDEMIAMLYSHPQLHVDVAGNDWSLPRKQFHSHLRRLVEAGFEKRILFGSDSMVWPRTIEVAIESIETAAFLTPRQKRDILHDNAARFLRLDARAPGRPDVRPAH